jgi:hypothetical protein
MDERIAKFLESVHTCAITTVRANGTAHVARVTCALVDGKLMSTGTPGRVRHKHIKANPRATYFIFDSKSRLWLGLEGSITVHEGPGAPELCLRVRQASGQAPKTPEETEAFLKDMAAQQRVVYELEIQRAYGAVLEE